MNQIAAYTIAGLAILGVTIFDGVRWERWGARDPAELDRFAEQLRLIPHSVGDWDSKPAPNDDSQIKAAEIHGHYSRIFQNRRTGATVNVFLVCGKTKPTIDHSPDQCYAAAGYALQGEADRDSIDYGDRKGEFKRGRFGRETSLGSEQVEILWAWTHDGEWTAPTSPQMTFASVGALYKLYVINTPEISVDGKRQRGVLERLPPDRRSPSLPGGRAEAQPETVEQT